MLEVEWTGAWPCLCYGEWKIKYDDKELDVPEDLKCDPMYTYGCYADTHFINGYEDIETDMYFDGLEEDEWIKVNKGWIKKMFKEAGIEYTRDLFSELYRKINEQDFRPGSCGGCL